MHPLQEFLKKEVSAGCQPRHPVKIPITTWKSLIPPCGLQLYPSCQAPCPVETSNELEILTCSICSSTFNDALTSGTSLFLLLLYLIQQKNQQNYTNSIFYWFPILNICHFSLIGIDKISEMNIMFYMN